MPTPAQIQALQAIRTKLGMNTDEYHAMLEGLTGKDSSAKLTKEEFNIVYRELKRREFPLPTNIRSEAQRCKIWRLMEELEKYDNDPEPMTQTRRLKRLAGIANRTFNRKKDASFYINTITKDEASSIINTLNRYIRNAQLKAGGDADG